MLKLPGMNRGYFWPRPQWRIYFLLAAGALFCQNHGYYTETNMHVKRLVPVMCVVLILVGCADMQRMSSGGFAEIAAKAAAKKVISSQLSKALEKVGVSHNTKWDEAIGHSIDQNWPSAKRSLVQATIASGLEGTRAGELRVAFEIAARIPGLPAPATKTFAFLAEALGALPDSQVAGTPGGRPNAASRVAGTPAKPTRHRKTKFVVAKKRKQGDSSMRATVADCAFVQLTDRVTLSDTNRKILKLADGGMGKVKFTSGAAGREFAVSANGKIVQTPAVLESGAYTVVSFVASAVGFLRVVGDVVLLPGQVRVVRLPGVEESAVVEFVGGQAGQPVLIHGANHGEVPASACLSPGVYRFSTPGGTTVLEVTLGAGQRMTIDMAQFNVPPNELNFRPTNNSTNEIAPVALAEEVAPSRAQPEIEDMVSIKAGEFIRGCSRRDPNCNTDYIPIRRRVAGYRIDRQEVTVRDYRRCVQAGGCAAPAASYSYCNWVKNDADDHPINCVTWHQADTYCGWAGKRLPASLEWEKAARGTDARPYPWGTKPPSCFRAIGGIGGKYGCGSDSTAPMCSKAAGNTPSGLCDMAGNVWEWVADDLDKSARFGWLKTVRRGRRRMQRGGGWRSTDSADFHTTSMRFSNSGDASVETGFRCAMDAE